MRGRGRTSIPSRGGSRNIPSNSRFLLGKIGVSSGHLTKRRLDSTLPRFRTRISTLWLLFVLLLEYADGPGRAKQRHGQAGGELLRKCGTVIFAMSTGKQWSVRSWVLVTRRRLLQALQRKQEEQKSELEAGIADYKVMKLVVKWVGMIEADDDYYNYDDYRDDNDDDEEDGKIW